MRKSRARYARRSVIAAGRQLGSIVTRVSGGKSLAIMRSTLVAMGSITSASVPACRAVTPPESTPDSNGYSRAAAEVPPR